MQSVAHKSLSGLVSTWKLSKRLMDSNPCHLVYNLSLTYDISRSAILTHSLFNQKVTLYHYHVYRRAKVTNYFENRTHSELKKDIKLKRFFF